jgi:Caspase domain
MTRRLVFVGLVGLVGAALSAPASEGAEKYALLIGVSDYEFSSVRGGVIPLRYAENDATALKNLLTAAGYKVDDRINREARREYILEALSQLRATVKEDDELVLFFAGHGARDPSNGQTYLLTHDTKLELLDDKAIRLDHLFDYVRDVKARFKLVLLDHCFSGDVEVALADGGDDARIADIDSPLGFSRGVVPADLGERVRSRASGMAVVGAASDLAFESEALEHGLFTEALIRALQTRRADTTPDGLLTVTELLEFVSSEVETLAEEAGVRQRVVPLLQTSGIPSWQIAKLQPAVDEAREQRTRDLARLQTFRSQGWISPATLLTLRGALDAWVASVEADQPLDPTKQKLLDVLRGYLAEQGFEDKAIAEAIEDEVRAAQP